MDSIMEVRGLNKHYPKFALKDVSFALPKGCITGLIGANGAGKTTILRTLLELSPRDSGAVSFFGLDQKTHGQEIKNRIGVVLDGDCFYPDLSLKEMKNILAPAYTSWCEEDFQHYLKLFSLDAGQKIRTLSKGMRMKYALALALSHKAELLILDEPTSGLDPLVRKTLLSILADFMERGGQGVFFSTHITSDLDKTADFLVMVDDGRIVFQEEKDALLDSVRMVKGDARLLNQETAPLFFSLKTSRYGFEGLTRQAERVREQMPGALFERASIEEIMLGYVEGGK